MQPSPQLRADVFIKCNLDVLDLSGLHGVEREGLDVLAALNDYINQPGKSAPALHHAMQLGRRVRLQLAHLRDLIQSRKGAMALVQAAASGHSALVAPASHGPGKRPRVIRLLPSANNAASDLFDLLGNAPQGRGPDERRGGEAEEASRVESRAKPGGLRSN
jgi:hypothetical protein